jgi:large subunit ribosomal protein L10
MPRPEKVQAVAEIKERLERANAVFLAEYAGLSVKQQQALRRGLREGGAEFKVVKMTLARRAAAELELTDLEDLLLGPTGIAFTDGDPVSAAKTLRDFANDNDAFSVKGGLLRNEFLTPERISQLAEIESRDVLLSTMAGLLEAPMASLAGLLAALPRNLASAMQQLVEKREAAGESAGEPAAAAEPESEAEVTDAGDVPEELPAAEADSTSESDASGEEETGEAVAVSEAEAEIEEAAETEAEPEAAADGDDAKSDDEDPADSAEEE